MGKVFPLHFRPQESPPWHNPSRTTNNKIIVFKISLGVGCTLLLLGDLGLNVTTIQSVFGYRNNWKVTFKQLGDVILCIVNVCKSEVRKFCRRYFVCLLSNLGYALQQYTLKFFFGNIQSAHVLVLIILMMILQSDHWNTLCLEVQSVLFPPFVCFRYENSSQSCIPFMQGVLLCKTTLTTKLSITVISNRNIQNIRCKLAIDNQ